MENPMKTINFKKNIKMPMVGFGTYFINDKDAKSLVHQAVLAGYRHLDTADSYGNEKGVGLGMESGIKELGISREEMFVTTKIWPGNEAWGDPPKNFEATRDALNDSLKRLKFDYVDLCLIHAPFGGEKRLEQWKALIELRNLGKARGIGVSNFNKEHIEEIKTAGLPLPDVNQIEIHPWSQKPELVSYLDANRISIIAYSSLVPLSSWRHAENQDSSKTNNMKTEGANPKSPFKIMAMKYGVSEAQVLLRWGVQKGYAVLPKSTSPERMRQNIDLFTFELDDADMSAIEKMDRGDGVAWSSGDPTKVS